LVIAARLTTPTLVALSDSDIVAAGQNVDDVQEATGEDPVAGEWKATGCAAAAATAMGTTAVPKGAS
jgi:hypothetical protein